jgi:hypothetical protein
VYTDFYGLIITLNFFPTNQLFTSKDTSACNQSADDLKWLTMWGDYILENTGASVTT